MSTEVFAPGEDGSVHVGSEVRAPGSPPASRRPFALVVRDGDRTALVSLTRLQALSLAFRLCALLGVKLVAGQDDGRPASSPPWELQRDGDVFDGRRWSESVLGVARRVASRRVRADELAARRRRAPGAGR